MIGGGLGSIVVFTEGEEGCAVHFCGGDVADFFLAPVVVVEGGLEVCGPCEPAAGGVYGVELDEAINEEGVVCGEAGCGAGFAPVAA